MSARVVMNTVQNVLTISVQTAKNAGIVKAETYGVMIVADVVTALPCVLTVVQSVSIVPKNGVKIVIPVLTVTIYPVRIAESVRIVLKACVKTVDFAKIVLL